MIIAFKMDSQNKRRSKVTRRKAYIQVENKTGTDLLSVSVAHLYSDVFKDTARTGPLMNGKKSDVSKASVANYNTGFFTTGKDWWMVIWIVKGLNRIYFTNPDNSRMFFDGMRRGRQKYNGDARNVMKNMKSERPLDNPEICMDFTSRLAEIITNADLSCGFKQHILRAEDAEKSVCITLLPAGRVEISSPSGTSETRYDSNPVQITA